ncbi:Ankyrin repeat family protein [Prunus dulcis]|uniref:Ankyrin repeat family protein n=1 Tax=Prunus dulcis TaxID=3755 RepID=A0A5H2XYS8_PRUDU|nr:Ankyrin repeat family protein [Prunus dulcis]
MIYMSDLIRRGRSMTTAPSSDPPAQSASAATAPALLDHVVVPASPASSVGQLASVGARVTDTIDTTSTDGTGASAKKNTRGPCRQLKTAKVTRVTNSRISIGYDERHRAAPMAELHSSLAHDIGHVVRTHCPMQWKSWRVMPDEIKAEVRGQLSTNYNLEDLDEESLTYVNRLFAERHKQWKSDLHHHFQAYDDPQVALQEGCPKELEGREDTQVNKGNRKKKTLLHHSGSRPFSYRMDARRREGSKFPEIDVFGDVYVRPGNELAESLHTTMVERSQLVLQESASQLPPETPIESVAPPQYAGFQILTETLDQTLGRRPGTYCRGMGNARRREPRPRSSAQSNSQVTVLTAQVATLENKLSAILQSLAQSGIPVPHFDAPTSEPVHPEHPHQTIAPVNAQTSDPHIGDDSVDFDSLFD